MVHRVREIGVRSIDLCDTIGAAHPGQVREYVTALLAEFPDVEFAVHIHDIRKLPGRMFVIAASGAFSWILVYNRIPEMIANAILSVVSNKYVILMILNVLLLILGVFLETNAIILMITPMLLPIASRIGVSYLEVGLIMVVNTSVGMLTPPMALNILIAAGIGNETIERIAKKVIPFLLVLILDIFIITYVPGFITWLPKTLGMTI